MIPSIALADSGTPNHGSTSPRIHHFPADSLHPTAFTELSTPHQPRHAERWLGRRALLVRRHRLARLRARQGTLQAQSLGSSGIVRVTLAGASSPGIVNWDAIARCESGGNWSINTGNGYWGGLQFSPSTWFANGGGPFDGIGPFPYSRAQQIAVAERVLAARGLSAWPYCGRFA